MSSSTDSDQELGERLCVARQAACAQDGLQNSVVTAGFCHRVDRCAGWRRRTARVRAMTTHRLWGWPRPTAPPDPLRRTVMMTGWCPRWGAWTAHVGASRRTPAAAAQCAAAGVRVVQQLVQGGWLPCKCETRGGPSLEHPPFAGRHAIERQSCSSKLWQVQEARGSGWPGGGAIRHGSNGCTGLGRGASGSVD